MTVKAVSPYIYPKQLNFKDRPFRIWKFLNPKNTVKGWYPKPLHGIWFRCDLFPTLWQNHDEARLVFVQPISLYFDAGLSVFTHEVVPVVWDCWPCFYDKMERWLKRHKVKTAFFTSRQEMEEMQNRCPNIRMIWCPEAVDESLYTKGQELKDRSIDLLEFGRPNNMFSGTLSKIDGLRHVTTLVDGKFIFTDVQLYQTMGDAKITICHPRSITHPNEAQGIETLTQRYWEAMLSRMIIIGHAPQELVDICGYNPCIEVGDDGLEVRELILDILSHIDDYQELVDKNREVALQNGDWKVRMAQVREFLLTHGYQC